MFTPLIIHSDRFVLKNVSLLILDSGLEKNTASEVMRLLLMMRDVNSKAYMGGYVNKLRLCISLFTALTAMIFMCCSNCMALNVNNLELLLDRDYFPEVKKRIAEANSSIRMIMFEASYYKKFKNSPSNQLIDALIEAKNRGVKVEAVLDVRQKNDRNTERNIDTAKRLKRAGVDVVIDSEKTTTHSKLLIIDEKIVVIGSTNWTYNALSSNHETSVVFDSKAAASELLEFFNKIKKTGKIF